MSGFAHSAPECWSPAPIWPGLRLFSGFFPILGMCTDPRASGSAMNESAETSPNLERRESAAPRPRALARLAGPFLLGLAAVACTAIAASTWHDVKTPRDTIRVTGSATQRIVSDLIEWEASVSHSASKRADAYRATKADVEATVAYLEDQGIPKEDIRVGSASVNAYYETYYEQIGDTPVSNSRLAGYTAYQSVTVTSQKVELVERVSREVTALLDRNIPIESETPRYHYTGLEGLKIEMLAEAADNARQRADQILASAGDAERGDLVATHMGVININPANSSATSWEGNNDKSSYEKDIITIVHVTYEVD